MKKIDLTMFHQKALLREKGFSLLELMISLSILAVSVLGLISLTAFSIQANLENDIRNVSIRLTNQTAEVLLGQPVDNLPTGSCGLTADAAGAGYNAAYVYSNSNTCLPGGGAQYIAYPNPLQTVRGNMTYPYNITWTVTALTNDLKQADITVSYSYKGRAFQKGSVLYIHRAL